MAFLKSALIHMGFVLFGCFWTVNTLICVAIIALPAFVYRCFVVWVLAPFFRPSRGNIVSASSQVFAAEFLDSRRRKGPRSTIVTTLVVQTMIEENDLIKLTQERLIDSTDEITGKLKYPEMQQYIECWMGFMFWSQDTTFDLKNHIHFISLDKSLSENETQEFTNNLTEELLNKSYHPKRSPWDVYIIKNVKYPEFTSETDPENKTVILNRCHHAIGDGFSMFQWLVEGMIGISMDRVSFPYRITPRPWQSLLSRLINVVKVPLMIEHDFGEVTSTLLFHETTPWHCPDKIKHGRQLYCRSPTIPIDKIKFIKNRMNCKFATVLLSSISAAVSHAFKLKGYKAPNDVLPFGVVLPLPGHPTYLTNHMTATVIKISTDADLGHFERLSITENVIKEASSKYVPLIVPIYHILVSMQPIHIALLFSKNHYICSGMSNFRGPVLPVDCAEGKSVTSHFCVGGLDGVVGVNFNILSIEEHLHVSVTAEEAIMKKADLKRLVDVVCNEINGLYAYAQAFDNTISH